MSVPLTTFTAIGGESSTSALIFSPAGETMKAGLSGFELRLGLAFILPEPQESKE